RCRYRGQLGQSEICGVRACGLIMRIDRGPWRLDDDLVAAGRCAAVDGDVDIPIRAVGRDGDDVDHIVTTERVDANRRRVDEQKLGGAVDVHQKITNAVGGG